MVFKWNDENTLLFLENFKNYQCLWNHKINEYKDRTLRANSIKSLISDLNLEVSEEDIKHKIKTIRTRYTTELTKIKQSTKSGCSSDDVYVPNLYWFKHAEFLSSVCVPRQSTSSLDAPLTKNENSAQSEQIEASSEQEKMSNSEISSNESSGLMTPSYSRKPTNLKRKVDMPIDRAIKELKTISEQAKVQIEDEFDLFCKSLAVQLKKMPLNRALICQEKLQSVMTRERLTQMSHSLPELIYSDSSTPSPFTINQSPLYQNTTPECNNYIVTEQPIYSEHVSVPMGSPQETNEITIVQTSTQEKENLLSQALQSIM